MPLGTEVKTGELAQSAGVSTTAGTAFIVAPATSGPEVPTLVRSLSEGVAFYGPREGESVKLYDALSAFFAAEGARAYVNRTTGEGTPKAALLELEAGAVAKTLIVTYKYKGTYGNSIKLEVVENSGKTASKLVVLNPEGEVLVSSEEYAKASELLAWGKTHETYVVITEGSGYSTGKAELVKKLASTKLATGTNPTVNATTTTKTIEAIPKTLGPGQLIVPGNSEEAVHTAMAEHASKNNRFALCDLKESEKAGTTPGTLTGEKGTYSNGISGYMTFFSTAFTANGLTSGTTRTIPAASLVAGLLARVSRTGNNNQAPAGRNWPLPPFVTGLVNTYTQSQNETLNNAGINVFVETGGVLCLYGDRTALSKESDLIFYQYSAARERMALVAECEEVGERYVFSTLDGRHQRRAGFQAALQAVVKTNWEANALYGATAIEAGVVNVAEPVNTPATEAAGELKAELIVRLSPVAEFVRIVITSVPITEAD
jgi:hypothetical protein